jgi:hypothetical protein
VLINAALSFFQANPNIEDPEFSHLKGSDLVFEDNDCAEDIVAYMCRIADEKQLYVSPQEFAQAALSATNIRRNGKDSWIDQIKTANAA